MIPSIEVTGLIGKVDSIVQYSGLEDDPDVKEKAEEVKVSIQELAEMLDEKGS